MDRAKLVKTPPRWAPLPGDSVRRTRARLGATLLSRLVARGGFLGFRVGPHDSAGYEPHDLGRVLAHDLGRVLAEWRPTSTAMPRSSQSNSEGAGATVEELRSRVFATKPCNAKRFISRMLRESNCRRGGSCGASSWGSTWPRPAGGSTQVLRRPRVEWCAMRLDRGPGAVASKADMLRFVRVPTMRCSGCCAVWCGRNVVPLLSKVEGGAR